MGAAPGEPAATGEVESGEVDLSLMDEVPAGHGGGELNTANEQRGQGGANPHGPTNPHGGGNPHSAGSVAPQFKTYFDLNLYSMPGGSAGGGVGLTFDNFHSFVMLDIIPTPDIQFSADVSTSPRFYELAYKLTPSVTARFGKIWVPFDDMNPHHIYGGRVNVSRLTNGDNFLPDIFTDLGVGIDWKAIETARISLEVKGYVLNGFRAAGADPLTPNSAYPAFGAQLPISPDNNKDKAIGGRAHLLISQTWGVGASYYTARWTDQETDPRRLTMLGADLQANFGRTTFRFGYAQMKVALPATAAAPQFLRGANYFELAHRLGEQRRWRVTARAGTQNLDDRAIDKNDRKIAGLQLAFRPNMIEFSLEFSRDLYKLTEKTNYNFTNLRVVAAF
ncbi:MAG: hypothetical protein EOP11_14990 [Proteobacteria bacterium]|nr:MAG: hypothetical protein EOP11_14990 [Pseudomonadota bacterium]